MQVRFHGHDGQVQFSKQRIGDFPILSQLRSNTSGIPSLRGMVCFVSFDLDNLAHARGSLSVSRAFAQCLHRHPDSSRDVECGLISVKVPTPNP
jgi:hypothetical protein